MLYAKDGIPLLRYGQPVQSERPAADYVPDLSAMSSQASSELRDIVERFVSDRDALLRFYNVQGSKLQFLRLQEFYYAWLDQLEAMPYEELSLEGSIDWHLLNNKLKHLLMLLRREQCRRQEMASILPIMDEVAALQESRRQFEDLPPVEISKKLAAMTESLKSARALNNIGPVSYTHLTLPTNREV